MTQRKLELQPHRPKNDVRDGWLMLCSLSLRLVHILNLDSLAGRGKNAVGGGGTHDELAAAKRFSRKLGLVIVDIDFFEKVNDNCGHDEPASEAALGTSRRTSEAAR